MFRKTNLIWGIPAESRDGVTMPEAQLAKQGAYSGSYGWSVSSTVHLLEEGHAFTHVVFKGTFFNDKGGIPS